MYRLSSRDANKILENNSVIEKESESHYLFGRNDVFSFDEDGSVYSLIDRENKTLLIHDFERMGSSQRKVSEVDKCDATKFLRKTGHNPFMRFDITRYLVKKDGKNLIIENVDQLGFFINDPGIGGSEVSYGDSLKNEMIEDNEKEQEVRDNAEEILQSIGVV